MKTYRFLGTEAVIGGAQPSALNQYGQKFNLPDEYLAGALQANAPILPEERFAVHNISEAEVQKNFSTKLHENASPEFVAKRDAAWEDMRKFREEILNPAPADNEVNHAAV